MSTRGNGEQLNCMKFKLQMELISHGDVGQKTFGSSGLVYILPDSAQQDIHLSNIENAL